MKIIFFILGFIIFLTPSIKALEKGEEYFLKSDILSYSKSSLNSKKSPFLNFDSFDKIVRNQYKTIYSNKTKTIEIKTLGIDYFIEYNSHHPYNRNNGTMIPNRGYQHIISPGIFIKYGPLTVQFKPEHHFSENKPFHGFWEGHYSEIWAKRYQLWNHIDMPERFGKTKHNKKTF